MIQLPKDYDLIPVDQILRPLDKPDFFMTDLFHISQVNHDGETFFPRVPTNRMRGEDAITPRVCFAESIEGAMDAIGLNPGSAYDKFFFVHVPEDFEELINEGAFVNPGDLVPDAEETHEVWCTRAVRMRCVAFSYAWVDYQGNIHVEEIYPCPNPIYSIEDLIRMYDEDCEEE